MTDFAEGVTLATGRYTIERRLGAGGMAAVWLARDERLGRPVAIKALSDTLASDPDYVRRFTREARVAAGLSHPNLVRLFDFGDDPRPYLVMEYVEGGTLAEHLRDGRPLDCDALVRRLLEALDHVHSARIVHRDVKPANVLVGIDGRARLTDFGIAQPEDATQLTQTGGVMGTMRYIAPEVLGGAPATPASDLYALGMVMRDCLGPGEGPLHSLADRLAAPEPRDRPQSAAAALAALDGDGSTEATRRLLDDDPPTGATRRLLDDDPPTGATRALPADDQPIGATRTRLGDDPRAAPTRARPTGRPASAARAAQPGSLVGRGGRLAATGLALVAIVVVLLVVLSTGGGDTPPDLPPRDAPLARQLDGLDRAVDALP